MSGAGNRDIRIPNVNFISCGPLHVLPKTNWLTLSIRPSEETVLQYLKPFYCSV